MKHLRLLLALFTLMIGGASASAQTDVTTQYITNAGFDNCTAETSDVAAKTIKDYSSVGWTNAITGDFTTIAVTTYGGGVKVGGSSTPNTKKDGTTASGNTLGIIAGWADEVKIQSSDITLPAGVYTLTVDHYLTSSTSNYGSNSSKFGFVTSDNSYLVSSTTFSASTWTTETVTFTLTESTTGKIQIGLLGLNKSGSGSPAVFYDDVKLLKTDFIDPTAITLSETSLSMIPTATKTLSVASYTPADVNHNTAITWTSSDESVATVTSAGVVTAVAVGTATITATTANNVTATCSVTVNEAPLANGDYYILNVSTGKYLGGANSWGSQASVINHGIPFYAELANGVYKLNSKTYNSDTDHFVGLNSNGDLFMDNAGTGLYITSLGSGKFSISTSDGADFLTASNDNTIVSKSATDASSELAQWKFITKDELVAALANATSASPVDATFYIADQNFSRNYWPAGRNTSSWTMEANNQNLKGGNNDNMCAESYHSTFTLSQVLTVPNGQYKLRAQACENVSSPVAVVYANDKTTAFKAMANNEGSMGACSTQFSAGNYYTDWITVNVTDNTLTVGAKSTSSANWCVWDNFELCYLGPTIGGEAIEKTDPMEADKWYFFDIAVDGNYNLTTTTLGDIVYTTDGTILIENENTVTNKFGDNPVTLTAGRYYVKSSSEQTLDVVAASYDYVLGNATLSVGDGGYTQSSTYTVTFPNAITNEPGGAPALVESTTATVNGETVNLVAIDKGFSLNLGELNANTDYTIVIPAGVYGYEGHSVNEAINVTIHTPAIFDGEYCLYDATNKLFLGRGANWGTEASADKYGIPFNLLTDATNTSSIEFVDWTGVYLFLTGTAIYTDNASTGWKFVTTDGGYYLKTADNAYFAAHTNGSFGEYVYATTDQADATIWTLKTKAERDAIIAAYPTENFNNVITASGITTTAEDFTTYLANYTSIDCTSSIGTAKFNSSVGDWTWNQVRGQDNQPAYGINFAELWNATGTYTQTISGLEAGIYKLTVQGYERRKNNDGATALYDAGYNLVSTFMSANGEQVRFTDWNEVEGKPTNTGNAVTAFNNGEAVNEVYVYLDGTEDLTITVRKPNYIWDCWIIFNNFTLTRYDKKQETVTIKKNFIGTTYSSEYPLDFSSTEGITAYIITDAKDGKCTIQKVEKVPARTGLYIEVDSKEANEEQNVDYEVKVYSGSEFDNNVDFDGNLLHGTVNESVSLPLDQSATYYLHGQQNGKESFFRVATAREAKPNKAYLAIPGANGAKALVIVRPNEDVVSDDGGFADGIYNIEQADNNTKIYNLNGQRVNYAKKGIYIKNDKKVIIK